MSNYLKQFEILKNIKIDNKDYYKDAYFSTYEGKIKNIEKDISYISNLNTNNNNLHNENKKLIEEINFKFNNKQNPDIKDLYNNINNLRILHQNFISNMKYNTDTKNTEINNLNNECKILKQKIKFLNSYIEHLENKANNKNITNN